MDIFSAGVLFWLLCILFWLSCITGFAVLFTHIAKSLTYRIVVFILTFISLVLIIYNWQRKPIVNGTIEKKVTMQITYEDGIPVDTVIVYK